MYGTWGFKGCKWLLGGWDELDLAPPGGSLRMKVLGPKPVGGGA